MAHHQRRALREIDPCLRDALDPLQGALNAAHATGAAHAVDKQLSAVVIVGDIRCRKLRLRRCQCFRRG